MLELSSFQELLGTTTSTSGTARNFAPAVGPTSSHLLFVVRYARVGVASSNLYTIFIGGENRYNNTGKEEGRSKKRQQEEEEARGGEEARRRTTQKKKERS